MARPALFAVLAVMLALPGAAAAQTVLQPGMWRITVNSTTNGKPDPAQDNKTCLKDELKDPARYFAPELEGVKSKCNRNRVPQKDKNVLGYRLKCTGTHSSFTTEAEAQVTILAPDHFTLSIRMDSKTPKERALVEAQGEAKRVGDCP